MSSLQDPVIPAEGMKNRVEEGGSSEAVESVTFVTKNQEEITADSSSEGMNNGDEEDVEAENINMQKAENDEWLGIFRYTELLEATLRGDWVTAVRFYQRDYSAWTAAITKNKDTALHIAIMTGKKNIHFVEALVGQMSDEELATTNSQGNTPLHLAAWFGDTQAAKILVKKCPHLAYNRKGGLRFPVHEAARNAQKETLLYLLKETRDNGVVFNDQSGAKFINYLITSNFYGIALEMVKIYPHLAILQDNENGDSALGWMAVKVSAFRSGSRLNFWQRLLYDYIPVKLESVNIEGHSRTRHDVEGYPLLATIKLVLSVFLAVPQIKHIQEEKQIHVQARQLVRRLCQNITSRVYHMGAFPEIVRDGLKTSIRMGIPEIIEEIAQWFPSMVLAEKDNILGHAITERHENMFNLVCQMSDHRYYATNLLQTDFDESILHLAALKAADNKLSLIPSAALQMQRELQWFEGVKKFVRPALVEYRNVNYQTPDMVFTKEHKDLADKGEKWMKDTTNSCTITVALIVTVVFAAAITVPGGHKGDTGLPIFSNQAAFIIFVVANAIALFTSTTSLLMFLSILTSRYAQGDFLRVLPERLILGLVTLFLSITTMMVAFSSTLYLMLGENRAWILIPVAAFACLPVTSFVTLQFPLLVALVSSTYGKGIFGKQSNRPIY